MGLKEDEAQIEFEEWKHWMEIVLAGAATNGAPSAALVTYADDLATRAARLVGEKAKKIRGGQ